MGHGFENRDAEAFVEGRKSKDRSARVELLDCGCGEIAGDLDAWVGARSFQDGRRLRSRMARRLERGASLPAGPRMPR